MLFCFCFFVFFSLLIGFDSSFCNNLEDSELIKLQIGAKTGKLFGCHFDQDRLRRNLYLDSKTPKKGVEFQYHSYHG